MSLASKVIETESPKSGIVTVNLNIQDTQLDPKQNPMPKKVIETEAKTELPNMSLDSKVIETEAPKDDMITVDLETQDAQLDQKQNQVPKKGMEPEAPKDDMVTVDLNTLDPKPNSMLKKNMTPRHKFKRIKKCGKVQKIQSPGVHKMKFKPSHKITDSQNIPIKSPNISCDSTALDTGISKCDSTKMVLEVQDTKQNYNTKALKMSKGSMLQMPLVKRRKTW